ncbi:MAG: helix-turn-helix transcriptional regulator [Acidobacteria bacterium]|nr:helix-turn-helix transcriptional regulator [Acidobacteriota bacterium]
MEQKDLKCPAETTLKVIGGRWKIPVLYHLFQGVKRFSELQHAIDGISQKVLTQQLREMERAGIIHREVYPQVPPKVEYSLTPLGETLKPVIEELCKWGIMFENGEFETDEIESNIANLAPDADEQTMRF